MRVGIVGGGWAGLSAAIAATQAGHQVTLLEASHHWGGRARAVDIDLPDGSPYRADNGQHILIGAYTDTLQVMRTVGIDPGTSLLRLPLTLQYPDGTGLRLPRWPSPLDAAAGILRAKGWSWADKASLLRYAARWQLQGFRCAAQTSVADLCAGMSPAVMRMLIEPLCVSALNTPVERSSGPVFLRVLHDALLGGRGYSNLLIPRTDLSALFPDAATHWLAAQGARLQPGCRVTAVHRDHGFRLDYKNSSGNQSLQVDAVLWATPSWVAAPMVAAAAAALPAAQREDANRMQAWAASAAALQFESICTVYVHAPGVRLPQPLLALPHAAGLPAQFVFDRGHFGGPTGLLAFVVSASGTERDELATQVLAQARGQLAAWLANRPLAVLQTVLEKRATFACTPGLQRPPQRIATGLLACGDYVDGPYPATLEGAVRSGLQGVAALAYH